MLNNYFMAFLRYRRRAKVAEQELKKITEARCLWTWEDYHEYWMTSCNINFGLTYIEPAKDDGFIYCPFCGKQIEVAS